MTFYNPDREWKVTSVESKCRNLFEIKSLLFYCLLEYNINVERFSSMYYSSIIVPGIGTINYY